jgi:hypothetical protein
VSSDTLVILPTIRNAVGIERFVNNARVHGFDIARLEWLVLTEDSIDKQRYTDLIRRLGVQGKVLNQTDREGILAEGGLSEYTDVFPRRSHAETSFGIFYAYMHGFPYGILLDDDVSPLDDCDFFNSHLTNLNLKGEITAVRSNERWVNVLYEGFSRHRLYPRGYPYSAMNETILKSRIQVNNVAISQGLWTNVPDLDAVRILMDGNLEGLAQTRLTSEDFGQNFTVEAGNYLTVCSMNLAFKRGIIPAFYQFKMDDNPWHIGRFDDIWSGLVAKKAMDQLGWSIINGRPLVRHDKVPRSTFKDLRSEVAGLEVNEHFWKVIDSINCSGRDIFQLATEIADAMSTNEDEFIAYNGRFFKRWIQLLEKVE